MNKVRESVSQLTGAESERYKEKIASIGGVDPYEIPKVEWTEDKGVLPSITYPDIVNYLVFTKSPYTMEDLKAYKGLEAYQFFVSGWVREPVVAIINDKCVVKARVSTEELLVTNFLSLLVFIMG